MNRCAEILCINNLSRVVTTLISQWCIFFVREQEPKIEESNYLIGFLESSKPLFKQRLCPCLKDESDVCYSGRFLLNFSLGTVCGPALMPVQCDVWEVISHNKGLCDSHRTVSCHPGKWKEHERLVAILEMREADKKRSSSPQIGMSSGTVGETAGEASLINVSITLRRWHCATVSSVTEKKKCKLSAGSASAVSERSAPTYWVSFILCAVYSCVRCFILIGHYTAWVHYNGLLFISSTLFLGS